MPPGDGTDDAQAIPMALEHGGRGPCLNASSRDRAQHVTPPTAADLGKLQLGNLVVVVPPGRVELPNVTCCHKFDVISVHWGGDPWQIHAGTTQAPSGA